MLGSKGAEQGIESVEAVLRSTGLKLRVAIDGPIGGSWVGRGERHCEVLLNGSGSDKRKEEGENRNYEAAPQSRCHRAYRAPVGVCLYSPEQDEFSQRRPILRFSSSLMI